MKNIIIPFISIIVVLSQIFFVDLFETSIKVTLLLICYFMTIDVRREDKQLYLFSLFFIFELLIFQSPGLLTLIVMVSEQFFNYLKELLKLNALVVLEYFSYFFMYFLFSDDLFSYNFFLNLILSFTLIIFIYARKYGFTKVFRN